MGVARHCLSSSNNPAQIIHVIVQTMRGITATASQLELIDLIVQYLTENGVMDPAHLYESPFTDISQQGPEALFLPVRLTDMVKVLNEIRQRAVA